MTRWQTIVDILFKKVSQHTFDLIYIREVWKYLMGYQKYQMSYQKYQMGYQKYQMGYQKS